MNIGVHRCNIVGGEGDAVTMFEVDVVEDVKHGLHVTGRELTCVG